MTDNPNTVIQKLQAVLDLNDEVAGRVYDGNIMVSTGDIRSLITHASEQAKHREREHNLIIEMKDEISKLKQTVNNLRQKVGFR